MEIQRREHIRHDSEMFEGFNKHTREWSPFAGEMPSAPQAATISVLPPSEISQRCVENSLIRKQPSSQEGAVPRILPAQARPEVHTNQYKALLFVLHPQSWL